MKKEYFSPEIDIFRLNLDRIMDDFISTPGDGGEGGDGGDGGFGD